MQNKHILWLPKQAHEGYLLFSLHTVALTTTATDVRQYGDGSWLRHSIHAAHYWFITARHCAHFYRFNDGPQYRLLDGTICNEPVSRTPAKFAANAVPKITRLLLILFWFSILLTLSTMARFIDAPNFFFDAVSLILLFSLINWKNSRFT